MQFFGLVLMAESYHEWKKPHVSSQLYKTIEVLGKYCGYLVEQYVWKVTVCDIHYWCASIKSMFLAAFGSRDTKDTS